jgi:hypothetical protein
MPADCARLVNSAVLPRMRPHQRVVSLVVPSTRNLHRFGLRGRFLTNGELV